jgi:hypothetical protein
MVDPNPPNYTNNGSTINNANKANDKLIDGKVIQGAEGGLALKIEETKVQEFLVQNSRTPSQLKDL